ncbi:trimethyllysine dioxygenase [Pelagibacterales bacterium SAG-MED13]|nr:trimethyllysine dioxygenase [Pelagibacterales bacterium SAG-MED13]
MIENIKILNKELKVQFSDKVEDNYPFIWLRDNAKDEQNWDSRSNQRKTFTASLSSNLKIKEASILDNGKFLNILWSDLSSEVTYSYDFLKKNTLTHKIDSSKFRLWKNNINKEKIFINYEDAISNNGFKIFLKNLYDYGFCVINNCKTDISAVESIAKKIGYVRQSIFGGLWSFESNENMADSAYTQEELRPHTDATYSNDAPGLQLLLCCQYKARGGESIMVDGFKIADFMRKEHNDLFKILSTIEVPGNYIGDGVCLESKRPIFKLNLNKEIVQISFNNYDRGTFRLKNDLMIKFYEAIKKFDMMANSEKFQWRYILKPGELLIFNNWRILHGRKAFKGSRKMSGCYINKEDFDSVCKINNII